LSENHGRAPSFVQNFNITEVEHKTRNEGENVPSFDIAVCKRKLYEFIDVVNLNGERFRMKDAWKIFCQTKDRHSKYPNMFKL